MELGHAYFLCIIIIIIIIIIIPSPAGATVVKGLSRLPSHPLVLFVCSPLLPLRAKAFGHPASCFCCHGKKIVYPGTVVGFVEFYVRCVCANVNKHVPEVWEHKKEPSCCLWTIFTAFPLGSPIFKSSFFVSSVIFSPWALMWCLLSGD